MALYMDIHKNVRDVTPEEVAEQHQADVETQDAHDVKYSSLKGFDEPTRIYVVRWG